MARPIKTRGLDGAAVTRPTQVATTRGSGLPVATWFHFEATSRVSSLDEATSAARGLHDATVR